MPGPLVGRECKLYYNAGTYSSPTWTEVTKAIDVDVEFSKSYGDVSARDSGWRKQKAALKELSMSFGYRYRQGVSDTVFDLLRNNAITDAVVELAVLDGASNVANNEGFRAYMDLAFNETQPLEDGVMCEFSGVHAIYEDSGTIRDPSWLTTT